MRFHALFSITCLFALSFHSWGKPSNPNAQDKANVNDLQSLQGIWEQVSLQDEKGKREELGNRSFDFLKAVKIFSGTKCYTVHSNGLGGGVTTADAKLSTDGKLKRLELVNPNDNHTTRSLFDIKETMLTICVGKTLKWPSRIAATDEFQIHVYRKLSNPKMAVNQKEDAKRITGIWETIESERDGVTLNKNVQDDDLKLEYLEGRKVFFFQDDIFTMVSTEDGEVRILHKPYRFVPKDGKDALNLTTSADEIYPAIFSRDNNQLVLCWNWTGGPRPNGFSTAKADGRLLYKLRRVDKAP